MPTLRSLFLDGPAGRLEALLNLPPEGVARQTSLAAALLCHPHPKGGGTMHNKVVFHAMKAMVALGLPVLRFNFRGVGASQGEHDDGHGEKDDCAAALAWLANECGTPLLSAGFSFGSAVGMRVCCPDSRVAGLVALGLPVAVKDMRSYEYPWLASCAKPKLFVSGGSDEYGPQQQVREVVSNAAGDNTLVFADGADHFFNAPGGAKLTVMQSALTDWLLMHFPAMR